MNFEFLKDLPLTFYYSEKHAMLSFTLALDARTKAMEESVGKKYTALVFTIKDELFTCYVNVDEDNAVSDAVYNKITSDPASYEQVKQEVMERSRKLREFDRLLRTINYSELSNQQLWELYEKFCTLFINMRIYSSFPTFLDGYGRYTEFLQDKLSKILEPNTKEFNEVFSVLTSPEKSSYVKQQEIDLLKVGLSNNIPEEIKKHTDKYRWFNYGGEGIPLTEQDFLQKLESLKETTPNFEEELNKIKQKEESIKERRKEFIQKYNLSEELQQLFEIAREFVWIKYYRKEIFSEAYCNVEFLLRAIGERINAKMEDVRSMLRREVKEALETGKANVELIRNRMKNSTFVTYEGESYQLNEEQIKMLNLVEAESTDSSELKGQPACVGKAEGIVKIVNSADEMDKVKQGDILVSKQTHPAIIPAMKLCSAIVTDLGGLTCHAAIVSRELQKPCIVGTKVATKTLKDGDLVKVDADKGVIIRK